LSFTLELAMVPRFGLEVSPALVAFGEMLMLPYTAMQSVIEDELRSNEALERLDPGECPICRGALRTHCPVCSVPANGGGADHRFAGATEVAEAESDAQALLRAVRLETSTADAAIVEYLIDNLDRHGFLDRSCEQLAAELGVDASAMAHVLDVVRRCGPPGVGATNVKECLLFQLDALDLDDDRAALARAVISRHLPDLARGHFALIATALGASRTEVQEVLELIRRRLRPYPAFDGNAVEMPCYVVPDVVVREHDEIPGEFTVEVVEPAVTRLVIRPTHRRRSPHSQGSGAAGEAVLQARSFLAQLQDRWETLLRVAEYAVLRQKGFLVDGPASLRPLTRAEVAAALNLHESTVSRAVADKYVLLPGGSIVPLSDFFGFSGGLDAQLRELLESADGPMSDRRLADLLRDAGYSIARRTVAKHRARLGLTAASMR
jgi:RNA polymerase sigma-54 factor